MNRIILLTLISALLAISASSTQKEVLNLHHVGQSKELRNNHITELFKDSRGFLWIGSTSGLFRYDGYSTHRLSDMAGCYSGALNEQILHIQEDALGRLWIKSESHLSIYNPETNILTENIQDFLNDLGIRGHITTMLSDDNGDIWVFIAHDGLYHIDVRHNNARKNIGAILSDVSISSLTKSNGKIFGVSETGSIIEVDPLTMKARIITAGPEQTPLTAEKQNIYSDNNGKLWIMNPERLMLYDPDTNSWQNDLLPMRGYVGVVKKIYNDSKGNMWLARDHYGIEKLVFEDGKYNISPIVTDGDFVPQSTIFTIIEDDNETILFGTYKLGLYSYSESIKKFYSNQFPNSGKRLDVNCMMPTKDGMVWVGTDNFGLWQWDPTTNDCIFIPDSTNDTANAVTALSVSPEGHLYIGKYAKGLYNYKSGKIEQLKTGSDIDRSYIWSLTFDDKGSLWIGTLGNGLFKYDPIHNVSEHFSSKNSNLESNFIMTLLSSKDGNIYMGTTSGVYQYNPKDKIITPAFTINDPSLKDNKIVQLFEDSRDLLWILTHTGIKVLDRKKSNIHFISLGNWRQKTDAFGIIEDNSGAIWISNSSRLTKYKVDYNGESGSLSVTGLEYDSFSGLPDCDFNRHSFAKLQDGTIAIGNPFGITYFQPAQLRMNENKPQVMFTDLYIDNKPVMPGEKIDGRVALKKAIFSGERIELNHNPKEFTIYFTSDNYALPEKTRFKYKLKGYSDQWTDCPEGINYVTYTNLSPGNYQLQVMAINEDGYESESPALLDIKIYPSFWGTPWAWIIYAIMAVILIWIIIKLSGERERRRLKEKNEIEYQRKQEELNQLKFKFFTNVSHDLRTPLTLIVSPLDDLIKESNDERQTKRLNQIRNNATRLLSLVNQLLDFRKSEESNLQLNLSEGDIITFAHNVCTSFINLSERKDINLTFYSDQESITLLFDEDKMEKIFMNLLGNAFKFTPAGGRIDIAITYTGKDHSILRIQVADTGIGIKDEDKKHIFERFYQAENDGKSHADTGSGIGLNMVSEYVKLHDGNIRVADNVERGSVFIIEIPIRHSESIPGNNSVVKLTEIKPNADDSVSKPSDAKYNQKTVLIVDDSHDMTEMLKDSLESIYNVMTASDGKDALKKIAKTKPDIILTDLMMPNMNGMELCRALKENKDTVNIPIIILTAKHDLGVKLEGLTIGADDYITKPFNLDVLRLRMKRLVELTTKGARRSLIEPEPEDIKITSLDEQLIEKAMKYVSQNISNPDLSVEGLSDYLAMSRVNLYKKMKQITGKSPIEFIRIIRLKRAAQLLRESQLNISEIAYQTGFNNPKMFSKYFKDEFGILPSAYQSNEAKETKTSITL